MQKTEELVVTPCGSRCVWASQSIVSSSRQMVEVLRTRQKTTHSRTGSGQLALPVQKTLAV